MFKSTLAAMAAVFALSALSPAAMAAKGDPHVLLTTSAGNIELELDKQKAPVSVQNFVDYVNSGFYNNTTFHRVIPGFMIQGGGFTEQMQQKKQTRQSKMKPITACATRVVPSRWRVPLTKTAPPASSLSTLPITPSLTMVSVISVTRYLVKW
ncbi:peptidyl-prolyl cis-trans isomerase A [Escherichia coli P0304777.2]|nr:peptidyl-prolyl cis-trans isomerase A [Escherichia coli P0304777.2]